MKFVQSTEKDHSGLWAKTSRPVSQKLDGWEWHLRTKLLSLAATVAETGVWRNEGKRFRSCCGRENRTDFCWNSMPHFWGNKYIHGFWQTCCNNKDGNATDWYFQWNLGCSSDPDYSGDVPFLKMLLVFAVLFLPVARLIWEKALMDWQRSSAISMGKIPSKRERSFCFAESVPIGARDSCGWIPDFYFCTNALSQDDYPGQGIHRKQRTLPKNSTSIL